jgi:hypothetical protein
MKTASRTLVKSPPEIWEQIDQAGRMQGLMSALLGHATEVEVTEREEESKLVWKAVPDDAWIEVEIAEKGWGTNVSVSAKTGNEPTKLEGWLDAVLDELATPQKRPFEGMDGTPPETVNAAVEKFAAVVEAPVEEEPPAEEAPVEQAPQQAPEAPKPPKKRRRFFGL